MSSSTTPSWHNDIDSRRKGAGYILMQSGRLRFDPADYIGFRCLSGKCSEVLIQGWAQWMGELKKSPQESVRRAAVGAPPLTRAILDGYYQDRLLKKRAFEAMESSIEQVTAADKKVTRLLYKEFEVDELAISSTPADSPRQEVQEDVDAAPTEPAVQKGPQKVASFPPRVSFGRNLTVEDLVCSRKGSNLLSDGDDGDSHYATPPVYSPRNILGADLPSSDPADSNFREDWSFDLSTSRLYTWDFLQGPGRVNSRVDSYWVCNGFEVGRDLMSCRDRIVQNNGGICDPYEMLAVNFIFLVEAEYQAGGIQGEVEDQVWDALYDTVRDPIASLPDDIALEALRWTHRLAQSRAEEFSYMLKDSPPKDRVLRSILTKMVDNRQLWNTQRRNEDTYLKSQLGPFLDTYFGKLRFTKSDWTPTQDDTRGEESSLLIPDYAVTTQVGRQQLSVVLLEGKIHRNAGHGRVWDDLTKLGQEMKLALDLILRIQPQDAVCVVGILVKEPQVEFFTMKLRAEGTYVMSRFAGAFVPSEAANAYPLVHLMEVFEHAEALVERTVEQVRQVKVHPSPNPVVPLSWLRPSFSKLKLRHIADGQ